MVDIGFSPKLFRCYTASLAGMVVALTGKTALLSPIRAIVSNSLAPFPVRVIFARLGLCVHSPMTRLATVYPSLNLTLVLPYGFAAYRTMILLFASFPVGGAFTCHSLALVLPSAFVAATRVLFPRLTRLALHLLATDNTLHGDALAITQAAAAFTTEHFTL
jgi:hypothetical protein